MSKAEKYFKKVKQDFTNFNKYFDERIKAEEQIIIDEEKEYLDKINKIKIVKPHQNDVGKILLESQNTFWELFDELKQKKTPFTILNSKKSFYVGFLFLFFGVLLLALSTIFS